MFKYLDKLIKKWFSIFLKTEKNGEWYEVIDLYVSSKTGRLQATYDDTITVKIRGK